MLPEIGLFLFIIGFLLSTFQIVNPIITNDLKKLSFIKVLCVGSAFCVLGICFLNNDFSVEYVAQHSNASLAWGYRIGAIWGGHAGSLFLFQFFFAISVFLCTLQIQNASVLYQRHILSVLGVVEASLYGLLLFTANPFKRILPDLPLNGVDLNPLLQDVALMIHPPILYMGYVGLCFPFAFVIARLFEEKANLEWLQFVKAWIWIGFALLTIGIALGSWWAYYELGWGGFWFWDPVENAALLPWLGGLALIHLLSLTQRGQMSTTGISLLSIVEFLMILLGFFLVRSGIVDSVHAFAQDRQKGMTLLIFLALFGAGSFCLYFIKNKTRFFYKPAPFFSIPFFLLLAALLSLLIATIVLLGTLFPVFYELIYKAKISVSPTYFNTLLSPVVCVSILLLLIAGVFFIRRLSVWMAHLGLVVMLLGAAVSSFLDESIDLVMAPGDTTHLAAYKITLKELLLTEGGTYVGHKAHFELKKGQKVHSECFPEKRFYFVQGLTTSEIAIDVGIFRDIYFVLGEWLSDNRCSVQIQYKPWIRLIWVGAILMALGTLCAWCQKKHL